MSIITEATAAVQSIGGAFVLVGFLTGTAVIFGLAWARGLFASPETVKNTYFDRMTRAHGHPGVSCSKANCRARHTSYYP